MRKIILCDLDGTLANCQHRIRHIMQQPKDWGAFFAECGDDEPIAHIIELVNAIDRDKYEIWITSGRSDQCKQQTVEWLKKHGVRYDNLIMRKSGDHTDDGTLKPSWLSDGTIDKSRVAFAIDDRNRVVKSWRDNGVPCLQVAEGDF
jgi:phosphoglycolate phosphatase-like HAD superfamily hydrolase